MQQQRSVAIIPHLRFEVVATLGVLSRALSADANAHLDCHLDHEAGISQQTLAEAAACNGR